ncbi:unnamed protein product [Effrenium voratum]|nr:unnamed protein product [Effrenium voratum]
MLTRQPQALMNEKRSFEDTGFFGAQGIAGFTAHLKSRFGSVLAGWRQLDADKKGRLSFHPFCKAARKSGYHGNMKRLWEELDPSHRGYVTLEDVDPHVFHAVSSFKTELMKKYGDMLVAWQEGLDLNETGRVGEVEVTECLKDLGLALDAKQLLGMFLSVPGTTHMLLKDFDPKAHVRWKTESFVSQGDAEPADAAKGRTDRTRLGVSTKDALIAALISRFGSLYRAWREGLDPTGRGRLSWGEFTYIYRRLGLHGDLQALWNELDTEQIGVFRFSDLDEETDSLWSEMYWCFQQEYGNMLRAWMKGVDVDGEGHVNKEQFVQACRKVGYMKDAGVLFEIMRPTGERHFLSLQDFDMKAYQAFMRNDFRMLSEPEKKGGPGSLLDMSLQERTDKGFFFQIRRGWQASKSPEFAKSCKVYVPPKQEPERVEGFANLCCRKYGSLVAAWRFGIDPKGRGQLNFNEFCTAVRRLGYRGSLRNLWESICPDGSYVVRLKDLDFDSGEAVTLFFETIHEKFEDLATVWSQIFKKEAYASISLDDLMEGCKALDLPEDFVEKLFLGLHPTPGQKEALFLWDLEDMFVVTRRLWERKKPKDLRRPVKPVGTSLIVAKEANEARLRSQKEAEAAEAGEALVVNHSLSPQLVRAALERDFVSTVACWNTELDWRARGCVTRGNFLVLMYRCGVSGNLQKLWTDLTGDRGLLRFDDLDPAAHKFLGDRRQQLLATYGNLSKAWHEGFDPDNLGIVDEQDFATACSRALPSLTSKEASMLFHYVMARHGQRSARKENWKALLTGLAPSERSTAWGEGLEGAADDSAMSPEQEQVRAIDTLEGFKAMLVAKYGSLFAAWKHALDREHNSYVMKQDFSLTCRRLGVKEVASLWRQFVHGTNKDLITLEVLHPETAECWAELHRLLLEAALRQPKASHSQACQAQGSQDKSLETCDSLATCLPETQRPEGMEPDESIATNLGTLERPRLPSLKDGWRRAFDPRNIRRVDRQRFYEGCKKLGYSKDPGRLFDLLRPEPFREYLVYEDLVTDLNPNKFEVKPNIKDTYLPMRYVAKDDEALR